MEIHQGTSDMRLGRAVEFEKDMSCRTPDPFLSNTAQVSLLAEFVEFGSKIRTYVPVSGIFYLLILIIIPIKVFHCVTVCVCALCLRISVMLWQLKTAVIAYTVGFRMMIEAFCYNVFENTWPNRFNFKMFVFVMIKPKHLCQGGRFRS